MPLSFPSSPSVGDYYSPGTRTWRWNGTIWQLVTPLQFAQVGNYVETITPTPAGHMRLLDGPAALIAALLLCLGALTGYAQTPTVSKVMVDVKMSNGKFQERELTPVNNYVIGFDGTGQLVVKADGGGGGGGSGDVVGPASAVNNRVVFFDGITGKLIKDSGLTLSGTNTGDQTIALTGDVTGSGTGTFAATIANDAVTFAKMQEISGTHLVGRHAGGTGNIQEVSVGNGVEFSGSGIRRSALTGDVTAPAGSNTTTLANTAVTPAAYTRANVTVDSKGRITAAENGGAIDLSTEVTGTLDDAYIASAATWNAKLDSNGDGSALTGITAAQVGAIADGDTLATGLIFPITNGVRILDAAGDHALGINLEGELTANRGLTFAVNDGNRSVNLSGNLTVSAAATISGTNSGNVTLAGTPDYITISGQTITRNAVDLASDITGTLPIANGGTGQTTAVAAFDALAPTTTKGDLIVSNGSDNVRVPIGTDGHTLVADSAEATGVKWAAGGGSAIDVQVFTADGTWTKPANFKFAEIMIIGGGGGGGSGRKGDTLTNRSGGGGGGAGAFFKITLTDADLDATEAVVVGAGGTGGVSQTADATNGNPGTAGGASTFNGISAPGGNFGAGGTTSTAAGGAARYAIDLTHNLAPNLNSSMAGGTGQSGTGSAVTQRAIAIPGGGGGGAGANTINGGGLGGDAGYIGAFGIAVLEGSVGFVGTGGNGASYAVGSGSNPGGNGFNYGSGGGGGSAGTSAIENSGVGGNGAPGVVVIQSFIQP
jgi:Repeat of unknown function (DUF5907)